MKSMEYKLSERTDILETLAKGGKINIPAGDTLLVDVALPLHCQIFDTPKESTYDWWGDRESGE